MQLRLHFLYITAPLLALGMFFPYILHAEQSFISNSISVYSSEGTSEARLYTEVDGKVLEDSTYISNTDTINVRNSYVDGTSVTKITPGTQEEASVTNTDATTKTRDVSTSVDDDEMFRTHLAYLMQLLALFQTYVSTLQ